MSHKVGKISYDGNEIRYIYNGISGIYFDLRQIADIQNCDYESFLESEDTLKLLNSIRAKTYGVVVSPIIESQDGTVWGLHIVAQSFCYGCEISFGVWFSSMLHQIVSAKTLEIDTNKMLWEANKVLLEANQQLISVNKAILSDVIKKEYSKEVLTSEDSDDADYRAEINRILNNYKNETGNNGWTLLYKKFQEQHGIDIKSLKKEYAEETWIGVAERNNLLGKLYETTLSEFNEYNETDDSEEWFDSDIVSAESKKIQDDIVPF